MDNAKHAIATKIATINTRAGQPRRDPLDSQPPLRLHAQVCQVARPAARLPAHPASLLARRAMRVLHEYSDSGPDDLTEDQFREDILHVKTRRDWKPSTIRQTVPCARLFFVEMLGREEWRVFSQIRSADREDLPAVLAREQVICLIGSIRLRHCRIPVKLISFAGLRFSECLSLTEHDILGSEGKLIVRWGKGGKARMVPLAPAMLENLRPYWKFHHHPLLPFPSAGHGPCSSESLSEKSLGRDLTRGVKGFGPSYPKGSLGDENRLFRPRFSRCLIASF